MKFRIVVALILTLLLLVVARRASMRQQPPIEESASIGEIVLEHNSSHIIKGDDMSALIPVEIKDGTLPEGAGLFFHYRPRVLGEKNGSGKYRRIQLGPGEDGRFQAELANQGRGTEFEYYLTVENSTGAVIATIPDRSPDGGANTLWLRFEGKQSIPLLVAHIAGMFGGLFFGVLAFLTSLGKLGDTANNVCLGKQVLWAVIIIFLGTFPIGIWIEYQVYATYWTGIPLGRDITDSKGLLVFLAWLVTLILLKGSALSADPKRNLVGANGARVATIASLAITLSLYLIPHSSGNF